MKKIIHSIIMTFSMYTKLWMPRVEWSKENKRYAFAFFPLVGVVEFVLLLVGYGIWNRIQTGKESQMIFLGILLTWLPILYTGGIHMDGFMDTCDALGSHASKERKLEIMKDSHIGSVAVLCCASYLLVYYLGMREIRIEQLQIFGFTLIAQRAICVLCLLYVPGAKANGLAADFVQSSDIQNSKRLLYLFLAFAFLGMGYLSLHMVLVFSGYYLLATLWYVKKMRKEFGGLTGDTSGFFLQTLEIGALWLILLCN